jgi:predicted Zn-dependent protease
MRRAFLLPALAATAMILPASASAQFKKPSADQQIKLGQDAARDLRKKEKVLPATDPRVKTLRRVAQRLLNVLPKDDPWEYSFDVIDSKEVNAFALPGGPVFFYTGLFDRLKTEDELAGVLAHELTHVRRQHWASRVAEQQKRNLLLTGLLILGRANSATAGVASLGNDLYTMQFSRGDENDADVRGFDTMVLAGYNPQGMADVFRMLGSLGGKQPEFLSDHPSDGNRVKKIEELAQKRKASGTNYPPLTPIRS